MTLLSHVPSDSFLILIPIFPVLAVAMFFYIASMSLSQMDVPSRQSYIVSLVRREEIVAAASLTNISRNLAQIVSPTVTGYLIQFVALSGPFFLGGGLRVVGAITLYLRFRKVPLRGEEEGANR